MTVLGVKFCSTPQYHDNLCSFFTPSVSKQKLRLDIICVTKQKFGEISLKLCQTNWNVAIINVNVVDDELPSQSTNNLHSFNN
jgi:hypothetical protein